MVDADYWQFPTVSMGLGPIFGIFQAHIMRYLEKRGLIKPIDNRKFGSLWRWRDG